MKCPHCERDTKKPKGKFKPKFKKGDFIQFKRSQRYQKMGMIVVDTGFKDSTVEILDVFKTIRTIYKINVDGHIYCWFAKTMDTDKREYIKVKKPKGKK